MITSTCTVCAWEAIQQRFTVEREGQDPPEFVAVSSGEVRERSPGVWEVPRAHVVYGGASLCVWHMSTALADQTTGDPAAN